MEQLDPHNLRSKSVGTNEGHTRNKYKTFNGINPLKNSFHNSLFLQEKEKGDKFFRNTKVGSCRKVLFKNGLSLAISFKIRNQKGEPLANYKHTLRKLPVATSTYYHFFCRPKIENHLGMPNKPLVPYDPNHPRNRFIEDFGFKMRRNFSMFNIGNERLINRKQWISTYRDFFKKFNIQRITNPGILSDIAKRTHYKLNI